MSMGLSELNTIECVRCSFSFWAASSEKKLLNEMEHLRVSTSAAVHPVHVASYRAWSFSRHALQWSGTRLPLILKLSMGKYALCVEQKWVMTCIDKKSMRKCGLVNKQWIQKYLQKHFEIIKSFYVNET